MIEFLIETIKQGLRMVDGPVQTFNLDSRMAENPPRLVDIVEPTVT